jgi:hypothetical protein
MSPPSLTPSVKSFSRTSPFVPDDTLVTDLKMYKRLARQPGLTPPPCSALAKAVGEMPPDDDSKIATAPLCELPQIVRCF